MGSRVNSQAREPLVCRRDHLRIQCRPEQGEGSPSLTSGKKTFKALPEQAKSYISWRQPRVRSYNGGPVCGRMLTVPRATRCRERSAPTFSSGRSG